MGGSATAWHARVALAVVLAAGAFPAASQEWRVSPAPVEAQGHLSCILGLRHTDYFLAITLAADSANLLVKSRHLIGVASGNRDAVIRFPSGASIRVTLLKDAAESDMAMVAEPSADDLDEMIDGFAGQGDFAVTVLGGKPTAFRIPDLPGAADGTASLRNCIGEIRNG